jgi:hypothetical protein
VSPPSSPQPTDRELPDRGAPPFAPDFVADAVNLARGPIGMLCGGGFVAAIALTAVLGAVTMLAAGSNPSPAPTARTAPQTFDPSRFILNALLVPALDGDAVPLRWVDPRAPALCGPGTEVRVNHEPLATGALVPAAPFEMQWQMDGCRPFGMHGPRFDGAVRLWVFREEWGLSARVEPSHLRVSGSGHEITLTQPRGAVLPFIDDAAEAMEPIKIGERG